MDARWPEGPGPLSTPVQVPGGGWAVGSEMALFVLHVSAETGAGRLLSVRLQGQEQQTPGGPRLHVGPVPLPGGECHSPPCL